MIHLHFPRVEIDCHRLQSISIYLFKIALSLLCMPSTWYPMPNLNRIVKIPTWIRKIECSLISWATPQQLNKYSFLHATTRLIPHEAKAIGA